MSRLISIFLLLLLSITMISCSFAPPKAEIEKKNQEIGLYEEWLMGLIALRNIKIPLYNPSGSLKPLEIKFRNIIKKLHFNASDLGFWRETYKSPEVVILSSRSENAFTLPGGFVCLTTGLVRRIYKKAKNGDNAIVGILAHELVHLYREHPKRHYVSMLLKNNVARQYRQMAEGIQAAAGDFTNDYTKLIIKTILKAKEAGTEGYQAEMEFEADVMGVEVMMKAGYNPKGLIDALGVMKHHMGGVHGSYEERVKRVRKAIKKMRKKYRKSK
ncbi:MAG: M48 family metalloprotease [Spirochaetota bacterium]|nr:M48 family metalloprotease [Spirochaetota bacterium]